MFINLISLIDVSIILFIFGVWGILLVRKDAIIILMAIELMLLGINLLFIFFSIYLNNIEGQIYSIFILTIAAAESAIGLAILVLYHRLVGFLSLDFLSLLKG